MGKAISELDSYTGPMSGTTKMPVSDSDTLKTGTASQVKTYIEGAIGTAQFRALLDDATAADQRTTLGLGDAAAKNTGTTTGTVAAGDHTHTAYAGTGAIGSSGLTMATAKLLGRSTAGTGAPEEITLGTNLSFTGTTLNAAGGGGTPSGSDTQVQFNDGGSAFGGDSGLTFNKTTKALGVGGATVTTSNPVLNLSQTWNAGAATFTGIKSNITDTASAAASLLADLQVGGVSKFSVKKDGTVVIADQGVGGISPGIVAAGATNTGLGINSQGAWLFSGGFYCAWASGQALKVPKLAIGIVNDLANFAAWVYGSSSGQLEINNGTAGTYRDLKLRNLIGTGNLATGTVAKSADYTATTSDGTIEVDASGAARTITLFAASGNAGKIIVVKKTDASANAVTVDGNASETIDGATTISLASQYSTAILQVNAAGTGWNKLSGV